jgi:hypothetical protein
MSAHDRVRLERRWREIVEQLEAINQGKTMPDSPTELESRLLEEQEQIEFLLGEDYFGPDDETVEE